jgi:predicted molibdopterin-dependent oxidoreductase YjgC
MLVLGNNPAVCYPNTDTVVAALKKLELLVVSEIFMTPTAEPKPIRGWSAFHTAT